jgi:hypothetical protein
MSAKTYAPALAGTSVAKKTYRFIQHHDLYRWTQSIFKYLAEARKKSIGVNQRFKETKNSFSKYASGVTNNIVRFLSNISGQFQVTN